MSRRFSYTLYGIFALAYVTHFVAERNGVHVPLVHAYMDDLLCIPLILFPLLMVFRLRTGPRYVFPPVYVWGTWLALSLVFEGWVPLRNPHFTADGWDVLLYGFGAVLFWFMQRPFGGEPELGKV